MGKSKAQIMKSLERLKKRVEKLYSLDAFILFGSYARGDFMQSSDIDIIIVSSSFTKPIRLRSSDILELWEESIDLQAICYTPKEFKIKKSQLGLVNQAVKEGVMI